MEITKRLYVTNRADWRTWLEKYHKTEREVWLVYPRVASGKARIPYNDAVEEALCFGWIDSQVKNMDEEHSAQRFSPRRPQAKFSQANIERLRALLAQGLVISEVAHTLGEVLEAEFEFPEDILDAIRADAQAWENYQEFSAPYKRIRVAFIEAARKRPEEFQKRLRYFIEMTRKNKKFGFGGIENHY